MAGDFISGVGYGMQIILFSSCASYLWNQRHATRDTKKTSTILLLYMCLMLAVSTMFASAQAYTVQDIYIDNRNYPGGPWAWFLNSQEKVHNVMFYVTLVLLTFLADLLVLWRCWVIWRASGAMLASFIVSFPAMMVTGSFVMGILWTVWSSTPGLSLYSKLPIRFGTAYYSLSLGANILLTILIASRLAFYRRDMIKVLPGENAKEYISLAAIFIESAALYSVMAILFIVTYAINHPVNQIWLTVASSSQQIAAYWIIYRVARGRAWTKQTLTQTDSKYTAPNMNFAPPTESMLADTSTVDAQEKSRA